jgi:hypothetical protein
MFTTSSLNKCELYFSLVRYIRLAVFHDASDHKITGAHIFPAVWNIMPCSLVDSNCISQHYIQKDHYLVGQCHKNLRSHKGRTF